ncbi:unnamed protein product [Chironomus riparius]|uniref:F-box domain-containing protein n=1 Tax=Chironomus riparius TaxID=315576 RepID=A0A9N9RKD5_9DIPT|nr:unnamed protein product [Chironomus riparius]
MMTQFVDLPPEILELLFDYLTDPKDICNISEACKRFKEVIDTSDKLTKKLTLYVNYPSFLHNFKAVLKKSNRRYKNLSVTRSRLTGSENQFTSLINAFELIGPKIRNLTINWCQLRNLDISTANLVDIAARRRLRAELLFAQNVSVGRHQGAQGVIREDIRDELHKEFIAIIKYFNCLETTIWNNVNIEKRTNPIDLASFDFTSLKQLKMRHCDAYCFDILSSAKQLNSLKISEPFWSTNRSPGIDNFETYLISQEVLKTLSIKSIHYPRLFHSDRSERIQFKLNYLVLKNVFFKEKLHAENFFKTQKELKFIDIQIQNEKSRNLEELHWYNDILKTVLKENPMLRTLNLDKFKYKIPNCDFLRNITNANVQTLNFNVTNEEKDAELFKVLVRSLPNLKNITYKSEDSEDNDGDVCFDKGTILDKVKALIIINASVKSLINVHAENLHTFEYSPKLNGSFIDDYIGGFLHRHRTIKELKIGNSTGRSYFFVSYNLCQLIVNFLNQLESITIYNFAEVNKSVKLLCNLRNLNTLTLSSLQYQQFTAKTKVECERMKLRLIPIEMNQPQDFHEYSDC